MKRKRGSELAEGLGVIIVLALMTYVVVGIFFPLPSRDPYQTINPDTYQEVKP